MPMTTGIRPVFAKNRETRINLGMVYWLDFIPGRSDFAYSSVEVGPAVYAAFFTIRLSRATSRAKPLNIVIASC